MALRSSFASGPSRDLLSCFSFGFCPITTVLCDAQDGRLVKHSAYRTFISYQLAERTPKGKLDAAYIFELAYAILATFETVQVSLRPGVGVVWLGKAVPDNLLCP